MALLAPPGYAYEVIRTNDLRVVKISSSFAKFLFLPSCLRCNATLRKLTYLSFTFMQWLFKQRIGCFQ